MNTGIQSSTATPYGAVTTTNPGASYRKIWPKDLMGIVAAHNIPYAATASLSHLNDLRAKMMRARETEGFRLLMIDGPCPPGHKVDPAQSIEVARLALDSCLYPLFEVEHMQYSINYHPAKKVPVEECLKKQGRFRHLFRDEEGRKVLRDIQAHTDLYWEQLNAKERSAVAGVLTRD